MSYCTLDDLIARAGPEEIRQVADRDRDDTPDATVVAEAIAHADNIVNGYVAARYTLPFAIVPDLVRTWAVSIARHKLHFQGPPDYVINDYKDAIASLKDVAAGKLVLPEPDGEIPAVSSGSAMIAQPVTSTASEILRGW